MSKSDQTGKQTSQDAVTSVTELMQSVQDASVKAMPGFGAEWLETMTDIGSEMLSFTAERIKGDVQTQHDLLHAKGLAEIQHIHAQFFQKAMDDYAAEAAKLMEMSKGLGAAPAKSGKPDKSE